MCSQIIKKKNKKQENEKTGANMPSIHLKKHFWGVFWGEKNGYLSQNNKKTFKQKISINP